MDSNKHIAKVLQGLEAATSMMNESVTPEIIAAMNSDQIELFEEAKKAGSLDEIKAMSRKLEKLNQNYK